MAKRFSETGKWTHRWFRNLDPNAKLMFLFLVDNCNLAGFLEMDLTACAFFTGLDENAVIDGLRELEENSTIIKDNWIWVKNFLRHQKNLPLNPLNNAHKHIILLIGDQVSRFGMKEIEDNLGAVKGLISPIGKGIGKGNGKEGGVGETKKRFDFDVVWSKYPNKQGRKDAFRHFETSVKTDKDYQDIQTALVNYLASERVLKEGGKFIQNGSTWFNDWQGWVDKKVDPLEKWRVK